MHSAWLVWHSRMHYLESYILWLIRQEQHSQQDIFLTDVPNAIYLPYVIKYNAKDKVAASRYAEIARRMGLPGTSEKALINSLCAKIDEFNAKMNIPKTLKEFGINEEEFKGKTG